MTIEECYAEMGGDYAEVCTRLPSLGMIEKFIGRFLDDGSFDQLCRSMETGNRAEAFRAAHTLKGVCANLSFTRLLDAASRLTEALRPGNGDLRADIGDLLEQVRRDYETTAGAIRRYLGRA